MWKKGKEINLDSSTECTTISVYSTLIGKRLHEKRLSTHSLNWNGNIIFFLLRNICLILRIRSDPMNVGFWPGSYTYRCLVGSLVQYVVT